MTVIYESISPTYEENAFILEMPCKVFDTFGISEDFSGVLVLLKLKTVMSMEI